MKGATLLLLNSASSKYLSHDKNVYEETHVITNNDLLAYQVQNDERIMDEDN